MNKKVCNVVKTIDRRSYLWKNDREHNELAVKFALDECYDLLKSKGYLFLNRVYLKLGLPLTKEGQTSGWVYDEAHKKDILWTIWHKNDDEVDAHITFESLENILGALPSEEEL